MYQSICATMNTTHPTKQTTPIIDALADGRPSKLQAVQKYSTDGMSTTVLLNYAYLGIVLPKGNVSCFWGRNFAKYHSLDLVSDDIPRVFMAQSLCGRTLISRL